jgi:hypothetical protein
MVNMDVAPGERVRGRLGTPDSVKAVVVPVTLILFTVAGAVPLLTRKNSALVERPTWLGVKNTDPLLCTELVVSPTV